MRHPFKKSLFDKGDSAFQALFLRTDVLSSQYIVGLGCWQDPYRSMVKAAQVCRREAGRVMASLVEGNLEAVLTAVVGCMQSGCRLNTRKQFPSTAHYLAGTPLTGKQRPHLPKRPRRRRTRRWPAGRGWTSNRQVRKVPLAHP